MAGSLIFGRDFLVTRDLMISVCDSVYDDSGLSALDSYPGVSG